MIRLNIARRWFGLAYWNWCRHPNERPPDIPNERPPEIPNARRPDIPNVRRPDIPNVRPPDIPNVRPPDIPNEENDENRTESENTTVQIAAIDAEETVPPTVPCPFIAPPPPIVAANDTAHVPASPAPPASALIVQPTQHEILAQFYRLREQVNACVAELESRIARNTESGAAGPSAVRVDASEQRSGAPLAIPLDIPLRSTGSAGEIVTEFTHL